MILKNVLSIPFQNINKIAFSWLKTKFISKPKVNMKTEMLRHQIIMYVVMVVVGILFNPMNILAYDINHLYNSLTLFYGGLLMASNMVWAHQIVHYFSMGHFNVTVFSVGIFLSLFVSFGLLRSQLFVTDKQWLRRMISHHSTALTTSKKINEKTENEDIKKLSKTIIKTQEEEIKQMKDLLNKS